MKHILGDKCPHIRGVLREGRGSTLYYNICTNSHLFTAASDTVLSNVQGKGASMTAELAQLCAYIVDAAKYFNQQREKSVDLHVHAFTFIFYFNIQRNDRGSFIFGIVRCSSLILYSHAKWYIAESHTDKSFNILATADMMVEIARRWISDVFLISSSTHSRHDVM